MSHTKVQELLAKLRDEMGTIEVDRETRSMLEELDSDIHDLLTKSDQQELSNTLVERAKILESRFATNHPVAERFARELIDTLARMGV